MLAHVGSRRQVLGKRWTLWSKGQRLGLELGREEDVDLHVDTTHHRDVGHIGSKTVI